MARQLFRVLQSPSRKGSLVASCQSQRVEGRDLQRRQRTQFICLIHGILNAINSVLKYMRSWGLFHFNYIYLKIPDLGIGVLELNNKYRIISVSFQATILYFGVQHNCFERNDICEFN